MREPAFLEPNVAVCDQLQPADVANIAGRGFRTIVNNRPDGEAWMGQPRAASLDAAAARAGIASHHIGFTLPTLTAEHARRLKKVLDSSDGPVLAFCASGFRSTLLWAIVRAAAGAPVDDLLEAAAKAGQPLDKHRETILRLAAALGA
ncbi:MAG: TIGR01244 family sulfur transferase [Hyphomicrobiaceae bacterium]